MDNQINIKDLLDKTLEGIDIAEEEKNALLGMYIICYYKHLLEALLIFRSKDNELQKRVVNFLESEVNSLPKDQLETFQTKIKEDVHLIFSGVLSTFRDNLPDKLQQIVDKNTTNLAKNKTT